MSKLLGLGLGVSLLTGLLWWFGVDDISVALSELRPLTLAMYLALAVVVLVGYALRWRIVASGVGSPPPLGRLVSARLAGDAVGAIVPSARLAGEPVRIAMLRAGGVAGAEAGAGVTIDRLVEVMGNMICIGSYSMVFWLTRQNGIAESAPLLLLAAVAAGLAALAVPLLLWRRGFRPLAFVYGPKARRALPRLAWWLDAVERTEDHLIDFVRHHAEKMLVGLLASLAIELLILLEYRFLLSAFGLSTDLPTLLLVVLGTGAARMAPTPAGLGALEATQVGAFALAGGRPESGLVAGVAIRMHETLWMIVGFAALYAQGARVGRLRASPAADGTVA